MHFTREPIIETIISPKDGFKLLVRPSDGEGREEFSVDAVEVVSFGKSYFFRSTERPKAFLLPVSEYEVVEARETRVPLKKATNQKSIKIAGGKEEQPKEEKRRKRSRRKKQDEASAEEAKPVVAEEKPAAPTEPLPPMPTRFIEPPTSLISDQIKRYKQENPSDEDLFANQEIEKSPPPPKEPEEVTLQEPDTSPDLFEEETKSDL